MELDQSLTSKTTPFSAVTGHYRSRIYTSNISINPLTASCDQILSLAVILKTTERPSDYNKFLQDLTHEIRSFEHRSEMANYPSNVISDAKYALCCLLDETIASTKWYPKSTKPKKTLLSVFYKKNDGSARFFLIINKALKDIKTNLHLIELMYICLNLGFTGQDQIIKKDTKAKENKLLTITNKLYQIISQHNHLQLKNIFIHNPLKSKKKHKALASIPNKFNIKKLFIISIVSALVISGVIFSSINSKLNDFSKPIYSIIEQQLNYRNE